MGVYRGKAKGTWYSTCRFKDQNGDPRRTTRRGFETEEKAREWEEAMKDDPGLRGLTVSDFFRVYERDIRPTVKPSTWESKETLFKSKIEPYLGSKPIEELSTPDILLWQDLLRSMRKEDGSPYSPTYLRTINNQIEAILNHAASFYGLNPNPTKGLRKMGKKGVHDELSERGEKTQQDDFFLGDERAGGQDRRDGAPLRAHQARLPRKKGA